MVYEMEELVPIVGKLVEKYTAKESSSVTYEKAEQLMGAVLYAINELEMAEGALAVTADRISARQAYDLGLALVEEKVKRALVLYNDILPDFSHYENHCLYDTFVRGLPEFFKRYNLLWEPQNTILTLDYPVLKDLSRYTGIDQVYEFIKCIDWEQKFLRIFPRENVIRILSKQNRDYKDMIDNICESVLQFVTWHILAGKPLTQLDLEETDYLRIEELLGQTDRTDIERKLESGIQALVGSCYETEDKMAEYLCDAARSLRSVFVS